MNEDVTLSREHGREPGLWDLTIRTRHPEDFELINHKDGERWRGDRGGGWVRIPDPDSPEAP
jgi:hypothetical protein